MRVDLKSDTLWYGSAVLIERALGLLLLPVLTRRLSEADYGIWAQVAVVSSVLVPLLLACMPTGIVRFLSADPDDAQRRRWVRRSLGLAVGLWGLLAVACWFVPAQASEAVFGGVTHTRVVAVALIVLAADVLFDVLVAYLRATFQMRGIAALLVLRGSTRLGVMLLALGSLQLRFEVAFALLAAIQLSLVIVACAVAWVRSPPHRPVPEGAGERAQITWRAMIGFCTPLVLMSVLSSAHAYADRFALTHQLGLAATAVYAAVSTVVSVVGVAYTVLGFTLFPVLSRMWVQGDRARANELVAKASCVFLFVALPFVFWLVCVSDVLIPLLTTGAYRAPLDVVLMLGVAAVGFGLYQIALYLRLLAGQGSRMVVLMLLAALVNGVGNWFLVPRFGLSGAAAAAALSNTLLAVMAYAGSWQPAKPRFPWATAARITGVALVAAIVSKSVSPSFETMQWAALVINLSLMVAIHVVLDVTMPRSLIRTQIWRSAR